MKRLLLLCINVQDDDFAKFDSYIIAFMCEHYVILRMSPEDTHVSKFIDRLTPLLEQRLPTGALARIFQ